MLDDFIVRAALAATGTAVAAGLLGCFVVWRRMAYFGDAVAHAAILGVALSLAFETSVFFGVIGVALAVALLIWRLHGRGHTMDTLLGVMAHGGLAGGLLAVSLIEGQIAGLDAYLFGNVFAVDRLDLLIIWGGAAVVLLVLWRHWAALLIATLSPDLAHAAGINPRREQLILTLMLATVVAVAIKVVGALLITALLIIPAATARYGARTPEGMAITSMGLGVMAALGGMMAALRFDTPVGPTIVCVAIGFFALAVIGRNLLQMGK